MRTFESIRNGLLTKASNKFRTQASELDREKRLFLDWMAYELYGLYRELGNSQDYIQRQISQRLTSEILTRPKPEYLIAHAISQKSGQVLKPSEHIFTIDRLGNEAPYEIYFSPINPVKLTGANTRLRILDQRVEEIQDSHIIEEKGRTKSGYSFHPGVVWLGVSLKNASKPEQSLTLYFDWEMESDKGNRAEQIPLIQFQYRDQMLTPELRPGNLILQDIADSDRFLDEESLFLRSLEKRVMDDCGKRFVALQNPDGFATTDLPTEIRNAFEEDVVESLEKEPVCWLKLTFPHGFSPEDIAQTKIRLNCFPLLNRKMDKSQDFTPSNDGEIEICALSNGDQRRAAWADTGDMFLGIERIFSHKMDYRATAFDSFTQSPPGSYSLQQGRVEAKDFRDAQVRAEELVKLLQQNAGRIKQASGHSVQSALQSLENSCQQLNQVMSQIPPATRSPGYYLHLKARDPQDMIYIRFWLTQGQAAEGVASSGDLLVAERGAGLEGGGVWVV